MKRLALVLAISLIPIPTFADDIVRDAAGNICSIASTSPTAVSTSSDGDDCTWAKGSSLTMQCSAAVYYSKVSTAVATSAKVNPGDPYPIQLVGGQLHISVLAVSGSATCIFYIDTRPKNARL